MTVPVVSPLSVMQIMLDGVSGALANNYMVITDALGLIVVGMALVFSTEWGIKRVLSFMQWHQVNNDFDGYDDYASNRDRQSRFRHRYDEEHDV